MTITHFDKGTPEAVKTALLEAQRTGRKVRVFVGEARTGEAWPEEWDIIGRIGNSTGPQKIALLIPAGKIGGPGLLTACIVGLRYSGKPEWLYRHPGFNAGLWEPVRQGTDPEGIRAGYPFAVTHNGQLHARFKGEAEQRRYIAFMAGDSDTMQPVTPRRRLEAAA